MAIFKVSREQGIPLGPDGPFDDVHADLAVALDEFLSGGAQIDAPPDSIGGFRNDCEELRRFLKG